MAKPKPGNQCPRYDCDFRSGRIQGLSRHLSQTHGITDKAERAALLGGKPAAPSTATRAAGAGTGRKAGTPKPAAAARNVGAGAALDNETKAAGKAFLAKLCGVRDRLDATIQNLHEVIELL